MREIKLRHKVLLTATAVTTAAGAIGLGSYASWSTSETTAETIEAGSFSLMLDGELVDEANLPVVNFAPGDSVTRLLDVTNSGDIDFSSVTMSLVGDPQSALLDGSNKGLQVDVQQCTTTWAPAVVTDGVPDVGGYQCGAEQVWGLLGDHAEQMHLIYDPIMDFTYWVSDYVYVGPNQGYYAMVDGWYQYVGEGYIGAPGSAASTVRSGGFSTTPVALPIGAPQSTAHLLVTVSMPEATGAGQDVNDAGSDYARYGNQSTAISYTFKAVQRAGTDVTTVSGVDDANGSVGQLG